MFVDNPVGTGFSYVEEGTNFTHNNAEIAADLLTFLKKFLHEKPEVRDSYPKFWDSSISLAIRFGDAVAVETKTFASRICAVRRHTAAYCE